MKIRQKMGQYYLRQQPPASRHKRGVNFSNAKKVGIIYLEAGEDRYQEMKNYMLWMKSEHGVREVKAYAYLNTDEKYAPAYQAHKLETDYFCKSDLNWYLKPSGSVMQWAEGAHDLLIDMTTERCLPVAHVVRSSNAAMKIGIAGSANQPYHDMSIALKEGEPIAQFIAQSRYYLSQLELV